MSEKAIIDLILLLSDDVWKNWGFIITVNLAISGWIIQRHGLYSCFEKIIFSLAYSSFIVIMLAGMTNAYSKLDSVANELAYKYVLKATTEGNELLQVSPEGIVMYFVSKSPKYCLHVKDIYQFPAECKNFSDNVWQAYIALGVSWICFMLAFWFERIWVKARIAIKK